MIRDDFPAGGDDAAAAERRLLITSMLASGALGAVGVVWGIAVGSQMILLDGVYAFVGITTSALLLWASALTRREPTRRFPFGLEAATPLAITIQAFVLLATLLYALVEAGAALRDGGSAITAGWAVTYGVVITVGSVFVTLWLQRRAGASELLSSEAAAWRVAALRGVGMVLGFTALAFITRSRWFAVGPYVDPMMVVVSCVALLPTPVGMLKTTLVELLGGAPPMSTSDAVHAIVDDLRARFELDEPEVYLSKVGPKLYVELVTTAGPDVTITQEHEVREWFRERLDTLPYEIWLNVELLPRRTGSPGGSAG